MAQSGDSPGRFLAAWQVLMGRRVTPLQIHAEWLEYKVIFDDILSRLSTQLARQAKMEKDRIKRISIEAEEPTRRFVPRDRKAELRSRAATVRGLQSVASRILAGPATSNGEEEEP